MRGLVAVLLLALVAQAAGCGDPPLCSGDVFLAIQTSQIVEDTDTVAPGVQADIRVRTSLEQGELVTLEVLDADRAVTSSARVAVDADGYAVFFGTSVGTPRTTLRATATSLCGDGADEVTIDVIAGADCELTLIPAPEMNAHYAPLRVLSTLTDPDPDTDGYQTTVAITTRPGWTVELFQNPGSGEQSVGTTVAEANGIARFPGTLSDGRVTFRATCRDGGVSAASLSTTVLVDTTRPTCTFTSPSPGTTITPAFDQNGDLADGVQLAITGRIGASDVAGEPAQVTITPAGGTPTVATGTPADADGLTTAQATLMPATTPATVEMVLQGQDHAGNVCTSTQTFAVIYDGCDISVVSPTGPVTADADGNPGNGSQADVALQVGAACVGRTVTSSCGAGADVPAGGAVMLRADVCATSPCEAQTACTFSVTTASGVTTSASTTIDFDDQGPPVSLAIVAPALACGAQITPASDADPATDGVQLVTRVTAPTAASRALEVTTGAGTTSVPATTDVTVTLRGGLNSLVGVALDALGNRAQTAACEITLADLSVSFAPPAADGVVNRNDGTVSGSSLTFPLCGTVNRTGTAVQLRIDGAAPVPATVTGTSWCRTITLAQSPPSHTIVATATLGASFGSSSLVLQVDVTPPPTAINFAVNALDRQRIRMTWQSPSDAGQPVARYVVKASTTPLTSANFDTTGTQLATTPPAAPGTNETIDLFPARTATAYWLGIATFDAAGNRSTPSIVGPVTPFFDRSGALTAPDPSLGNLNLGYEIAHGRFNDDAFEDLAISAPGQTVGGALRAGAVYVYFGGPSGIAATPSVILTNATANGAFGAGLTAVRWSSMTRDDLVVGAPGNDGGAGRVFVFRGGATFGTGTRTAATAELTIAVNATTPGWFAGGALGSSLVRADVDGDGVQDLVASAPNGGGGAGGIAILYGGTVTADVALSSTDNTGVGGAVVELFQDPGGTTNTNLGFYLHAVGRTQGPADPGDDLVVAYADNQATAGDSLYVLRGSGVRPAAPGVTARAFTAGRDVRIDLVTIYRTAEWGGQAITIEDQDGDGCRDLVISAFRNFNGPGQVQLLSGCVTGSAGVTTTTTAGTTLTTFNAVGGMSHFGSAIFGLDGAALDVDGDGHEDLVITGVQGTGKAFVWFGGSIPTGTVTAPSATTTFSAPSTFGVGRQAPRGRSWSASWVGDLDGDGLIDACWAAPYDNSADGSFEILAD